MAKPTAKYLIILLLLVLLFTDNGLCGPKKKKSKKVPKKVGESSSPDAIKRNLLKRFVEMKKREGGCFLNLDALDDYNCEVYKRQILKARENMNNKLQACHETYEEAIASKLNQLGLVGQALREWLYKINELAILDPELFRTLNSYKGDLRDFPIIRELFEVKIKEFDETPTPWIPFGAERPNEDPSDVSDVQRAERFKQTLQWRAYNMGSGICVHLKEHPLWSLYQTVALSRHLSILHNQEIGIDLLPYEQKLYPDEFGYLTMTGSFLFLRYICKNFSNWNTKVKMDIIGKAPSDNNMDTCIDHAERSIEMFGLNGEFSVFVEELGCDIKKFYRLRESIRCLVRVEDWKDIKNDLAMLVSFGNRLITGCLESLEDDIRPFLQSIMSSPAYDKTLEEFLGVLGNYMKKEYVIIEQSSMVHGMAVRSPDTTHLEGEFFLKEGTFDKFDIVQGYLDGTRMCDLFKSNEWKHFINTPNKLIEFYEVFSEFSRTQKFRLEGYAATHPAMTINQLWNMCQSIEILPLRNFSISNK